MDPSELQRMCGRVSQLLAERLGARGHTLPDRIASRHRTLPRKVRRAALDLAEAQALLGAPKVVRQLDHDKLHHAYQTCLHYLEPLDAPLRFGRRLLEVVTTVVLGLLIMAGVGFAFVY
ncbi:hypothetical protein C8J27_102145 [Rhodobacter aestuarii]|uniref:Uncharacterized protein n=1 Tax=Rhodobacter aestuarii TaxID=453582 RepID=A0A1N7NAY6_9RHOB|nr:hypothetical protein [Rhodobacter aestuarii]PTV96351.1 hypothetical protein C8J27_102145 [Rhodobacter aestuarii]SIS95517.1 hypothetical protein SAMN05421580_107145 [Rhodobacter aestuarii]